jgi:hypothetical protein
MQEDDKLSDLQKMVDGLQAGINELSNEVKKLRDAKMLKDFKRSDCLTAQWLRRLLQLSNQQQHIPAKYSAKNWDLIFGWINKTPVSAEDHVWLDVAKSKKIVLVSYLSAHIDTTQLAPQGEVTLGFGDISVVGRLHATNLHGVEFEVHNVL